MPPAAAPETERETPKPPIMRSAMQTAARAVEIASQTRAAVVALGRRVEELERSLGRRIRAALERASDSQVDAEEARAIARSAESTATTTASVVTTTIIEERRPFARWQSHVFIALLTVAGAVAVEGYRECRAGPRAGHALEPELPGPE